MPFNLRQQLTIAPRWKISEIFNGNASEKNTRINATRLYELAGLQQKPEDSSRVDAKLERMNSLLAHIDCVDVADQVKPLINVTESICAIDVDVNCEQVITDVNPEQLDRETLLKLAHTTIGGFYTVAKRKNFKGKHHQ